MTKTGKSSDPTRYKIPTGIRGFDSHRGGLPLEATSSAAARDAQDCAGHRILVRGATVQRTGSSMCFEETAKS
jgi:hypothetical protein